MSIRIVSISLVALIALAAIPSLTEARNGGYYSYGYRHYSPHYRHHGHHYGYRRHYYRHYSHHGYPHRRYYRPHYYHGYSGYHSPVYKLLSIPAYLAYGILKIPATILGGLTGSHYYAGDYHDNDRHGVSPGGGRSNDNNTHKEENGTGTGNHQGSGYQPKSQSDDRQIENTGRGWNALVRGRALEALRYFGQQAQANPRQGEPKVGYALAAASAGNLDRGVWAMRRALKYDADALHYLQLDDKLQQSMTGLIERYQARLNNVNNDENSDAVVMITALHYLRGDISSARQSMIKAGQSLNNDGSLVKLGRLIDADNPGITPSLNKKDSIAVEQHGKLR